MIKVDRSRSTLNVASRSVKVSGLPAEMMLFYCMWQTTLWPNWMAHLTIGIDNTATKQHKGVIELCNEGKPIRLCYEPGRFEDALEFAISQCKAVGIVVEIEEPDLC